MTTSPSWIREVTTLLAASPQFVMSGNTQDLFVVDMDGEPELLTLTETLSEFLQSRDYPFLITLGAVEGIGVVPSEAEHVASEIFAQGLPDLRREPSLESIWSVIRTVTAADQPAALLISAGSRLVRDPTELSEPEFRFFRGVDHLASTAEAVGGRFNPVFWSSMGIATFRIGSLLETRTCEMSAFRIRQRRLDVLPAQCCSGSFA